LNVEAGKYRYETLNIPLSFLNLILAVAHGNTVRHFPSTAVVGHISTSYSSALLYVVYLYNFAIVWPTLIHRADLNNNLNKYLRHSQLGVTSVNNKEYSADMDSPALNDRTLNTVGLSYDQPS
jgi:hypothetical protein